MVSYMICDKNIRYRRYPCPTSSVFDPRLSIFVFKNIHIYIRSRSYPYLNSKKYENKYNFIYSLRCSKGSHPARDRACTKEVVARVGLGFGRRCP
jgi:hypothetical protein